MKSPNAIVLRSVEDLADAKELRSVISTILASAPIDEPALRHAVRTFVRGERHAAVPPALVITRVTDLVDDASIPFSSRTALTRRAILWCVEEYFGRFTGDALGMDASRAEAWSTETSNATRVP